MSNNVREVALDTLLHIEKNQAYSNLLLNQMIKKEKLSSKDVGLLTEIVYGTVQRKLALDYYLQPFLKKQKKLELWVMILLRLSLYQMVYLDRIPERAVIHEAVEIAKKRGHRGISGMVNGVLRSIQREGLPDFNVIKDDLERLSIEMSLPLWLLQKWAEQYGLDVTKEICKSTLEPPMVSARVNCNKAAVPEVLSLLEEENVVAEKGNLSIDAILISNGNLATTKMFQEGYVTIQDESSMLVARALGPQKGDKVLDSCAAPGGKTTHIAELLGNDGKVISVDLHPHKVKLIEEQVKRLKLTNVETLVSDSRHLQEHFNSEEFDRILVDAPCSGFGVIRRKPDIKYSKKLDDIGQLAAIQLSILNSVAPLLKNGGTLVYSTCTIDQEENAAVAERFLAENKEFIVDETLIDRMPEQLKPYVQNGQVQILPHYFGTDGFFIASFRKQV
ncbi:16S rRNA (cytosine(967)-C(5))-methyltransferase RsmB [Schinkia azotoformans]|uniref:16S rRNA (cytosine(967)-C(5))-methyltransferase n=1 Tax=Schinkia azotoformans LMG 9581 TaxID=1131731 RepID=K6DSS1_SCHAZ|nr:16S rRNA (cytosine(967)-C(5))-methyltransferase RsmB [Schinkia azotoformans]EKN63831.1 16S rRNA methyltransferase B [Schinkia azotoformans LMG 9581]MEC1638299.1 16S rRNA (cytosine(967)-C(5))-methyltransferase RsmB [Schinkia azotoformans]MEC1721813.1 16S rRNA (cytosine(967)-C(5))-methyltransferase RsmB [Schinkia azotoformans]MEC1946267.1 16S rRNA (cytosine(967)-C(5))-methyltransferase RsmB [Schinkia azotoformans]MED4351885.1 16S rRNA (cytosine(967)-C(5))-methyltransferase RsmB [Schinkia azot